MPLRDRQAREWIELVLRIAAIAILAWALWLAARPLVESARVVRVTSGALREQLADWARRGAPDSVHVTIDSMPDDTTRAWLVALRRAGTAVGWSGDISPVALVLEPVNAPAGGMQLRVAAPRDAEIALRDAVGPLDSVRVAGSGAALRVPAVAAPSRASSGGTVARAHALDSLAPGAVLVLGTAGWESRYVVTALEEAGWQVDARLTIGPGMTVDRGAPAAIDTARYVAIIVLDSAAAREGRRLAAYARSGGGLILGGAAAGLPGVREVAAALPGQRVRPAVVSFTAGEPRRALGFVSLVSPKPDALVLESRDGRGAIAARRAGAGRVLQIGYDETWRWRMQGGAAGPESHRRWWSGAVAATARQVAFTRSTADVDIGAGAPLAALTAALGAPSELGERPTREPARHGPHPWMLIAAAVLLLAEWASRRLRGVA